MRTTISSSLSTTPRRLGLSLSKFPTQKSPIFGLSRRSDSLSLFPPMENPQSTPPQTQHVVVMRHGDRLDNFEPIWLSTAARPWDPPLFDSGINRAFCTGRKLRKKLTFPIHRVFVSPFLRCIQTAAEAVAGLCAVNDNPSALKSGDVTIDPTKVKISIELGLCEMLNNKAIRPISAPKDGQFSFDVSELQSLLPSGTFDCSAESIYAELPKWPEELGSARNRYVQVIKALSDKFPNENLLLVTHGEAVGVSLSAFMEGATVYEVEYCAYTVLKRPNFSGEFEVDESQSDKTGIQFVKL